MRLLGRPPIPLSANEVESQLHKYFSIPTSKPLPLELLLGLAICSLDDETRLLRRIIDLETEVRAQRERKRVRGVAGAREQEAPPSSLI